MFDIRFGKIKWHTNWNKIIYISKGYRHTLKGVRKSCILKGIASCSVTGLFFSLWDIILIKVFRIYQENMSRSTSKWIHFYKTMDDFILFKCSLPKRIPIKPRKKTVLQAKRLQKTVGRSAHFIFNCVAKTARKKAYKCWFHFVLASLANFSFELSSKKWKKKTDFTLSFV